jgi:anti-sigma B factor antagonist
MNVDPDEMPLAPDPEPQPAPSKHHSVEAPPQQPPAVGLPDEIDVSNDNQVEDLLTRPLGDGLAPPQQPVVVGLPDEIDINNADQVLDALTRPLGNGLAVLVADASETTFCGSAGIGALIHAHRQAEAAGTHLRVAISPLVWRVLELTGADQVLDVYPSLAEALIGHDAPPVT